MPRLTDHIPIKDPFLDRRFKLLPCQREMIFYWYGQGYTPAYISKIFKVTKTYIIYICRGRRKVTSAKYSKDKHRKRTLRHFRHKDKLRHSLFHFKEKPLRSKIMTNPRTPKEKHTEPVVCIETYETIKLTKTQKNLAIDSCLVILNGDKWMFHESDTGAIISIKRIYKP